MAKIIDGKAFAATLRGKVKGLSDELKSSHNVTPGLAVVIVGEDPASQVYVRNKGKQATEVGFNSYEHKLPETTGRDELIALIDNLNADDNVHAHGSASRRHRTALPGGDARSGRRQHPGRDLGHLRVGRLPTGRSLPTANRQRHGCQRSVR